MVSIAVRPHPNRPVIRPPKLVLKLLGRRLTLHAQVIRRTEDGATLIEMAIVLPVFIPVLFGIFTYSIILFGRGNAICAANLAARYAATHSSAAVAPSTTTTVKNYATSYIFAAPVSGTTVTTTYPGGNTIGGTVIVTISVTYPTVIPFYNGSAITITGSAQRTISR